MDTKCTKCGALLSKDAKECPVCNTPTELTINKQNNNKTILIFVGLVIILVGAIWYFFRVSKPDDTTKKPNALQTTLSQYDN